MVEGTQTVKVDLEIEESQPGRFKINTTMYIGDWYGSDWDDINVVIYLRFLEKLKLIQ